jgi:hypothetical protein
MNDTALRQHLQRALNWGDAHVTFDDAVAGVAESVRGTIPKGTPHSLWHLVEHVRRVQWDILDFCRNPKYVEPSHDWYWPPSAAPKDDAEWNECIASFRRDLKGMQELADDRSVDLFAKIPNGSGQTYLREILLVIDHNSYEVGQIVLVRRLLGDWTAS